MSDAEILALFPPTRIYHYRSDPATEPPTANVSIEARRFGFRLPVLLTDPVWRNVICWDATDYPRPVAQQRPTTRHQMRRVEALLAHADSALNAARNRSAAGYPPAPTRLNHYVHTGPDSARYLLGIFLAYWRNGKPTLVIDMDPSGGHSAPRHL